MNRTVKRLGIPLILALVVAGACSDSTSAPQDPTPAAPSVETLAATEISSRELRLNGRLNPNNAPTEYFFRFGFGQQAADRMCEDEVPPPVEGNAFIAVSCLLAPVPPGTPVTYRLEANSAAGSGAGQFLSATTPAEPPTIETLEPTDITTSGGRVHAFIETNGRPMTWWLDWGMTAELGSSSDQFLVSSESELVDLTATIIFSGMSSGMTIHYRFLAENSAGLTTGDTRSFTTN